MKKLTLILAFLLTIAAKAQTHPACLNHTVTITAIVPGQTTQTYGWNTINVCGDLGITLVANGADSYTWKDGNTEDSLRPVIHYASNPFAVSGLALENGNTCESIAYIAVYGCYSNFYGITGIQELNKPSVGVERIEYTDMLGRKVEMSANEVLVKKVIYLDGTFTQTKFIVQ